MDSIVLFQQIFYKIEKKKVNSLTNNILPWYSYKQARKMFAISSTGGIL